MKVRYYLTDDRENEVVSQVVKSLSELSEARWDYGVQVHGLRFKQDAYGIYTETDSFLLAPTMILENKLPIYQVTIQDEIDTGNPDLGIYEAKGAQAILEKKVSWHELEFGSMQKAETWIIRVKGATLESAATLYKEIRSARLAPQEKWVDMSPQRLQEAKELADSFSDLVDELEKLRKSQGSEAPYVPDDKENWGITN